MLNLNDPICKTYVWLPSPPNNENELNLKNSKITIGEFDLENHVNVNCGVFQENFSITLLSEFFCTRNKTSPSRKKCVFDFLIRYSFFYRCQHQSIESRILFFILLKFFSNSYAGWRHFLKLPVNGNRTWSNRKSQRRQTKFFDFYMDYYFDKKKYKCQKSKRKAVVYAEFVNKFYFFQFRLEYEEAKKRRIKYERKNFYVGWKFDLRGLLANRVIIHAEKKEKQRKKNQKKKQKKKVKIRQNVFNIGFDMGFTRFMEKKIFRHFFVTKRAAQPRKKKKKKK